MSWIEEEQHRRSELEKRRQAKAQKSAGKAAKELEKQRKYREKQEEEIEHTRMKLVERFANHVKKRLPEGTRIHERFVLSDDSNEPAPAVRIDVGNGVKLDLVKYTYKVVNFRFTGSCSADESSTTTHVVFDIFESGKATASRVDVPLIKIQKDLSRVDVPLIRIQQKISKESLRDGFYDAYQRLNLVHGNLAAPH